MESVLVNGEEMIGQVQEDGTLVCQADSDLTIIPTYYRVPSSRFEAESTTVVDADNNVISGTIVQDEAASGGAYMGSTGGKGFVLESTTQANRISVAYASPNTATILVYLLQDDGNYEEIGAINFSTTQGWYMDSLKIAQSDALYIPEGSTVKLVPQVDVNLDYFTLSYGPLNTEENIAASTVLAKNATLNGATVTEDIMSTIGTVAKLDQAGQSVSFTIPEDIGEINVYNLKYRTELDTPVSLTIDGSSKEMIFSRLPVPTIMQVPARKRSPFSLGIPCPSHSLMMGNCIWTASPSVMQSQSTVSQWSVCRKEANVWNST